MNVLLAVLFTVQTLVSGTVPFVTVAQGASSQILEPRNITVRTAAEWQALWKAHDSRPAPGVDFSQSIVVGVFLGLRRTAGFSVEITAINAKNAGAVVQYAERRPSAGAATAQVLTSPFHLVSMPRDIRTIEFLRIE